MEAFEIIGLVGNIITFINFGSKVVRIIRETHESASGATRSNDELAGLAQAVQKLAADLASQSPSVLPSGLSNLRHQCKELSEEILQFLENLRLTKPGSKRAALKVVWNNVIYRGTKDELAKKLDRCQRQLEIQLVQLSRYVPMSRPSGLNSRQPGRMCALLIGV